MTYLNYKLSIFCVNGLVFNLFLLILPKPKNLRVMSKKVKWVILDAQGEKRHENYAVSSDGQIVTFLTSPEKDGEPMKFKYIQGYPVVTIKNGKEGKNYYVHRLIAEHFVKNPNPEKYTFVVHKDWNKENNHPDNLMWTDRSGMFQHIKKNPNRVVIKKPRKKRVTTKGRRLDAVKVLELKKKIFDPDRRVLLKTLAKEYGITEMQLYRIKRGDNWSHIRIPEEDNPPPSKRGRKPKNMRFR
jgi:hypothetical protein